ncbi:MAG TPA: molybdenum metabolism regulator, partial [Hyphomonas sp.]|nr:molybdenum metabolism regulator [Hyphomonas sp.]
RTWGRIGTQGRTSIETLPTLEDAENAASRALRQKMRRGYRPSGQLPQPYLAV